ncbi:olfactory receptor 10-like [Tachyglossus aculeatus]|uniref:olfactory receptor 10-like n=1 Tax=Tachyglossus aculeatus TaxID=9261 RepID=UPI0018F7C879|nr:olfactory receptor 10-like [Tachyglossus aculeatus]
MAANSWFSGGLNGGIHTDMNSSLLFSDTNNQQFICDIPSLIRLTCSKCYSDEIAVLGLSVFRASAVVPPTLNPLMYSLRTRHMTAAQRRLYVFLALGSSECVLLAVIALDNHTNMFAMLKLTCVDVRANEIQFFVGTLVMILLSLSLFTVSYRSIARDVLRSKSPLVWRKALGSCRAHLLVVTLYYGSITVVYIWPNSSFTGTLDKFLTLFYTLVTPPSTRSSTL